MTRLTEAEQILGDLVAIPSVTENRFANDRLLDYVEDILSAEGMHTVRPTYKESADESPDREYSHLVATTQPTQTPKLMIVTHGDVVPATSSRGYRLREKDGIFYGRGTADMKFAIANTVALVLAMNRQGVLQDYDFGLTVVTNEEIGGKGAENLLKDGYVPHLAYVGDNGSNWDLEKLAKGAWTIDLNAVGVTAHGSRPWEGDSATDRLGEALTEIRRLFAGQGPETDTCHNSLLTGGQAQNQLAELANATLDIRFLGKVSLEKLQEKVDEICRRYRLALSVRAFFPALEHDMQHPGLVAFKKSIKAVTGKSSGDIASCSSCDATYYDKFGVPTIVTRPACGGDHSDNEWIERRGFGQMTDVLGHFVVKNCRVDG